MPASTLKGKPRTSEPKRAPKSQAQASFNAALRSYARGDLILADEQAREALEAARLEGDQKLTASLLGLSGAIASFTEKPADALQVLQEAIAAAEATNDAGSLSDCLMHMGRAHMHDGNEAAARSCFVESLEVACELQDRSRRAAALAGLGWAAIDQGDSNQAQVLFLEAKALSLEAKDKSNEVEALCFLGEIARQREDYWTCRRQLQAALALAQTLDSAFYKARSFAALARLAKDEARFDDARDLFEKAVEIAREAGLWFILVRSLQGLSQSLAGLDDPQAGEAALVEASVVGAEKDDKESVGTSLFALGRLARARGDEERAVALHHQSLAVRKQTGRKGGVADSLHALAGLLAQKRPDNAGRLIGAAKALRNAPSVSGSSEEGCPCCSQDVVEVGEAMEGHELEVFLLEGARLTEEQAIAFASRGRGTKPKGLSGLQSLSPTELEVCRLIKQGLTNPEIGERLFMSSRTVGTHLYHIYPKLQISSRKELRQMDLPEPGAASGLETPL